MTETFLTANFSIPTYYCKHLLGMKNQRGRPMRGVTVFYRPILGKLISFKSLENSLILNFSDFSLVACYFHPNCPLDDLWDELSEAVSTANNVESLIVAGDMNCRVDRKCEKGDSILEFAFLNCITLANSFPFESTYCSSRGQSVIDLIFYGPKIYKKQFSVRDSFLRKHNFVCFSFEIQSDAERGLPEDARDKRRTDFAALSCKFSESKPDLIFSLSTNDVISFYSQILKLVEETKINQSATNKKGSRDWFDSICYEAFKDLLFLRTFIKSDGFAAGSLLERFEFRDIFFSAKRAYRVLCKKKKADFQELQDRKILLEAEAHCHRFLRLNGSSSESVANDINMDMWARFLGGLFNSRGLRQGESLNLRSLVPSYSDEVVHFGFLKTEIELALGGMKNKKAPGPDNLQNEVVKLLWAAVPDEITAFLNVCLELGSFPHAWKNSNLKLLYKGKGGVSDVNSYRGISLCCSLYNLLDRVMSNRLYSQLIDLIPANQFGFVKRRSTIQAVQVLVDEINFVVYEQKMPLYALFLDVKKAFDSVSRYFIFEELVGTGRFSVGELNLLAEMLDANLLTVRDGISVSESIVQSNGVKQGGSMSPFLFIFALSDINSIFVDFPDVKIILYADDMVLLSSSLDDIRRSLELLIDYLAFRDLELNFDKCKIMKFRKKGRGRLAKSDTLIVKNEPIEFVSEFTYLGVVFQSSGISFSKHIAKKVRAAILATAALKSLPKSSLSTALKIFDLAVAPIASYGIQVIWPYLTLHDLNKLETVKSRFLKKALCLSKFMKSRLAYELADSEFFMEKLASPFSLPESPTFDKFIDNQLFKISEIDPAFYGAPAMVEQSWKNVCYTMRHALTRHACHGFHFLLCKRKIYHTSATKECVCKLCDKEIDFYHFLSCDKNDLSLSQAANL
ncbi:Hypothetical predicted protein [Cloeon dipterum]|uniref:Reverse transcriptase domain-containing protein n=1 Tax=Cloeon dipterum TaxID=197152 RepID=A0A8S1DWJ1_9INSE|nr:Hypothetical predicted protein [Cloeon dipterum]